VSYPPFAFASFQPCGEPRHEAAFASHSNLRAIHIVLLWIALPPRSCSFDVVELQPSTSGRPPSVFTSHRRMPVLGVWRYTRHPYPMVGRVLPPLIPYPSTGFAWSWWPACVRNGGQGSALALSRWSLVLGVAWWSSSYPEEGWVLPSYRRSRRLPSQ
jgi:hypothetical protein